MHLLMQVPLQSSVSGRICFARAYRGRSETYRQRNINSKHTVHRYVYITIQYMTSNMARLKHVGERLCRFDRTNR